MFLALIPPVQSCTFSCLIWRYYWIPKAPRLYFGSLWLDLLHNISARKMHRIEFFKLYNHDKIWIFQMNLTDLLFDDYFFFDNHVFSNIIIYWWSWRLHKKMFIFFIWKCYFHLLKCINFSNTLINNIKVQNNNYNNKTHHHFINKHFFFRTDSHVLWM